MRLPKQNHNKPVQEATNFPPLQNHVPGTSKDKEAATPPPPNTEPTATYELNIEREENDLHKDDDEGEVPKNKWQQTTEQRKRSRQAQKEKAREEQQAKKKRKNSSRSGELTQPLYSFQMLKTPTFYKNCKTCLKQTLGP